MLEKQIERYLVKTCKEYGGMCIKLTGYVGIPDRLVMTGDGRVMFVELKRPGQRLRPEQEAWQGKLKRMGFEAVMIDSYEKVDSLKSFLS